MGYAGLGSKPNFPRSRTSKPKRLVILTAALPSRLGNMEHASTAWFRLVLETESSCAHVVYGGVVGPTAVYRY